MAMSVDMPGAPVVALPFEEGKVAHDDSPLANWGIESDIADVVYRGESRTPQLVVEMLTVVVPSD